MAGIEHSKKHSTRRRISVLISVVAVFFLLFLLVVLRDQYFQKQISFPYVAEERDIQVMSLIQFDGPNIDEDGYMGENIAGLQVKNISDKYISEADIELVMENGASYHFMIQDLPNEAVTTALEKSSRTYDKREICTDIKTSVKTEDISMREDAVDIQTDGTEIIVANISQNPTGDMTVIYRYLAGDSYIGGRSYKITVPPLEPGESYKYEDTTGVMGLPYVVGVQ